MFVSDSNDDAIGDTVIAGQSFEYCYVRLQGIQYMYL